MASQNKSFDDTAWQELMRHFSINWQKSKSTEDAPIWHPVEGKGYVIWISRPHVWNYQKQSYWRIIVSTSSSIPAVGRNLMNELIQAMVDKLPGLESIEPKIMENMG